MTITLAWGAEPNRHKVAHVELDKPNRHKVAHVELDKPNKIFIDGLFPWKRSEIYFTSLIICHETIHDVLNRMGLWFESQHIDLIHATSKCDYTGLPKAMSQGKL